MIYVLGFKEMKKSNSRIRGKLGRSKGNTYANLESIRCRLLERFSYSLIISIV